jgi:hypothetical protein
MLSTGVQARTWTSADGSKTFEGELKSFDATTGTVNVTQPNGKLLKFTQDKLSAADIEFLKDKGKPAVGKPGAAKASVVRKGIDGSKLLELLQ